MNTSTRSSIRGLGLAAIATSLLALTACTPLARLGPGPADSGNRPAYPGGDSDADALATAAAEASEAAAIGARPLEIRIGDAAREPEAAVGRTGSLAFRIRWPGRTAQAIPQEADRLEFVLTGGGGGEIARSAIQRPAESLRFDGLPEGTLTVTVRAFRATDTDGTDPLAMATDTVVIKANQRTTKAITLQPVPKPFEITLVEPLFAFATDKVSVYVANLKIGARTATMSLGAAPVATADVDVGAGGSGYLAFEMPADVDGGKVLLTASGYTATSSGVVTRIASISVSPVSANGAVGQPTPITVKALDAAGNSLAGATVPYTARNTSDPSLTPTQIGYFAPGNGYYPNSKGNHEVVFGKAGVLTATVSITVAQ